MDYVTLGRTGLKASLMGLGAGGPSRIGKGTSKTTEESIAVVRHALDNGINIIDTAEFYRTEKIIGEAIKGYDRESIILSTKKSTWGKFTPEAIEKSFSKSLQNLGTDYIDIYHLHAVLPEDYPRIVSDALPTFKQLQKEGKIRYIGITERFDIDSRHEMLEKALKEDIWDIMMIGFNILNQTARESVFPKTIQKSIGTLIMFPVRLAFSRSERLKEIIKDLIEKGKINSKDIDVENPLQFLIDEGGAESLVDAAYRFCRFENGADVILSGTGDIEHLKDNIKSFSRPPLPDDVVAKLRFMFRNVDTVSGQ